MEIGRTGVIALAVLVGTAVASIPAAADGGPNGAYADRDYYPSIWHGLYAGVHVGFGDGDGVLGGGQVGYNWQSGRVVYGIEADFAASSIEEGVSGCISSSMGSRICAHASASLDWLATVRGRIGYLIDPRILAYATAGVGIASWSAEAGISGCNLPECPEISSGAERQTLSSGWVLKAKSARQCRPASTFFRVAISTPTLFGQA